MNSTAHGSPEDQIGQWRAFVARQSPINAADVDEMEDHLRGQIDDLASGGLSQDEAFLVAVKRMGAINAISAEFAREHSERLWKQLVLGPSAPPASGLSQNLAGALLFAAGSAASVVAAVHLLADNRLAATGPLIVLLFVAGYFAWQRRASATTICIGAGVLATLAAIVNLYPWTPSAAPPTTQVLAFAHSPMTAWFVVGLAYAGGAWNSARRRMDFIRFTGEWVVYMVLLALGGGALMGLTGGTFASLGIDPEEALTMWIMPAGVGGAAVIAAWLVEAKQSVVENIAPVLTRVFTPLTVLMLVAVLVVFTVKLDVLDVPRDLLTLINLILVLVLGLVLYAISARDPGTPPALFDRLQVALLAVALLVDAVLLVTMLSRIIDAGLTANKVAALGLNLVLLVNLVWSARLSLGFVRGRTPFAALEDWQTSYLPVYALWAVFVVAALPPIFGFG